MSDDPRLDELRAAYHAAQAREAKAHQDEVAAWQAIQAYEREKINEGKCAQLVYEPGGGFLSTRRRCVRKPGHGDGGLYCKQHAKRHPSVQS